MEKNSPIAFVLSCLKPFKWLIASLFIVAFIWSIDLSLRPYLLKMIFDRVQTLTPETIVEGISMLVIFYCAMSLLITVVFRFHEYLWINLNPFLKRYLGDALMKRMMDHSQSLFQNHFAGNLANKIKDVMSGVPDLVKSIVNDFSARLIGFSIAIFTVGMINFKFAVLLGIWLVTFVSGTLLFLKNGKKLSIKAAEVRSTVVGHIVDIMSNIMSVHLFASKKTESQKLMRQLNNYVAADQKRDWWFLYMFAFQGFSFVIYQAVVFYFLIIGFKQGYVTVGDFALLLTLNVSIITELWGLSKDITKFSETWGGIIQGLQIVLTPIDLKDMSGAKSLQLKQGQIKFDRVTFHYKGTKPLFNNTSIIIEPGQKVGLVGYSGGGKTTFCNLILRLYDVTEGRILIDGQDIRDVTQDSLRAQIGMIPQDPSLFHRTLMENIRYGRADATDAEVITAAKRAHAHEFITKLPNGYDALVGERGVKLSGGQRQRVAIARAMLKNAPILILDEATSQLDSVTERDIQDSLWHLMHGKTTIVIAHRLSTLLNMDRILVFDGGQIVEDGSHDQLLGQSGLYKTLWDAQVGGFLGDGIADIHEN